MTENKAIKWFEAYSFPGLMAFIFITVAVIQYFTLPYSDLTNLLWESRQMIGGATLYTDIAEINPPLILWLYAPWVLLGKMTGMPAVYVLKIATFALIGLVLYLSNVFLGHSDRQDRKGHQSFLLLIAALLLLLPNQYLTFAQREHWFPIFIMPYVILQMPSVAKDRISPGLKILAGIFAGIGFCIKPQFFAIWVSILFFRLLSRRNVRNFLTLADKLIIATTCAYIVAICVFAPHYFAWMHILRQIYMGFGGADAIKWIKYGIVGLAAVVVAYGSSALTLPKSLNYRNDTIYLLWVTGGALAEGLLQFKTWIYIFYPFLVFGAMAVGLVAIFKPEKHFFAFAIMALLFFPSSPLNDNFEQEQRGFETRFMREIAPYSKAPSFYFAGLFVAPARLEMYEDGMQRANKMAHLNVFMENIMQVSPVTDMPLMEMRPGKEALQSWLYDSMSDELEKKQPQLLIVSHLWHTDKPEDSFDFMEWFRHSPRMSRELRHYKLRKQFEACADPEHPESTNRCSFDVFTRVSPESM